MVWQEAETLGQEIVPFQDALDRILAEDVVASDPLPPFRASIKDGYAVLSADRDGVRAVLGASHAGAGVEQRLAAGKLRPNHHWCTGTERSRCRGPSRGHGTR